MKSLRQLCVSSVCMLALAVPAFAGEIQTGIATPPPAQTVTAAGEIQTGVAGQIESGSGEATAADSVAEIALNLLQSVLSLF
ncbi:MAG: hypothetical protein M3416_02175 [Acidobacteriota bacterium]|nr:hypothetical protein [Acidobacteriota bacterium]